MTPEMQTRASVPVIFRLSQELIDQILDIVLATEEGRRDSLLNCSLISRAFRPRSQKHLFSRIQLMPGDNGRIGTLLQFIEAQPSIANHIEELCLAIDEEFSWVSESPEIFKLVGTNLPLKRLVLIGADGIQTLQEPEEFVDRFIHPSMSHSITTLELQYLENVPPQLLSLCHGLKNLILDFAYFQDADQAEQSPIFCPIIDKLVFSGMHSELSIASSRLNFSNLRHLSISWNPYYFNGNVKLVQEIIDASKGSLESLALSLDSPTKTSLEVAPTFLDLASQPKLHTLEYCAILWPPEGESESDGLTDICRTLRVIPTHSVSSSNGSSLSLNLVLHVLYEPRALDTTEWDAFTSEISRISAKRPLELSLTTWHWYDYEPRDEDLSKRERELLQAQCQSVLEKVVDERLASVKSNENTTITHSFFLKRLQ